MEHIGRFEGARLSRSRGYLEPAAPGDGVAGVLSGLAVTAFGIGLALMWMGVLA